MSVSRSNIQYQYLWSHGQSNRSYKVIYKTTGAFYEHKKELVWNYYTSLKVIVSIVEKRLITPHIPVTLSITVDLPLMRISIVSRLGSNVNL